MTTKKIPLVSIFSLVYNHRDYIGRAIESFLMQETNFDYEIVIGEDFSTDGTRDIVFDYAKKYPDQIRVITSDENVGAMRNAHRTKMALRGKYVAMCEGDDYWIDPHKLQKQVDFLEANPDYGMVHTDLHEYNTTTDTWRKNIWSKANYFQSGDIFDSLYIGRTSMIYLLTAMVRKDLISDYSEDLLELNLAMGDLFLWMAVASKSKVGYFNYATGVRQLLDHSATQGIGFEKRKYFLDSITKIIDFFSDRAEVKPEIQNLGDASNKLRYLELYRLYNKKEEFKKLYTSFRKDHFELEATLLKMGMQSKPMYYMSRALYKLLFKLKLDFTSKARKKLKRLHPEYN